MIEPIRITALALAQRFLGTKEVPGSEDNPMILSMLRLDGSWPKHDEVPWCSAFVNYVCWLLNLPRSHSLLARSWLSVGHPVFLTEALPGFDIVVLKRGKEPQPGIENMTAPGHVGFYVDSSDDGARIQLFDGNVNNEVTYSTYPRARVLSVRRLKV
jgi:uncharacterized protein (TIGR02594 family)